MRVVYSPRYQIDIGPHVFPTRKYQLVYARLIELGVIQPSEVFEPEPAGWDELGLVHTAEYLAKMRDGTLSREELAELELPWSAAMVEGFRLMVGGTVQAGLIACGLGTQKLKETPGPVCHLGGGLHHAFPNHGEGFCPFNDVAVAARALQARGVERVAIIDLDVHHGNGTAFIFNPRVAPPPPDKGVLGARGASPPLAAAAGARLERGLSPPWDPDASVFTFSMHQQSNYPMWKPRGTFDIGLPGGTGDARYLRELGQALPKVMASEPQCVFYLAGADPYEDDQLGGLRLTQQGLRQRDRLVIETVRLAAVPLVVTLAGGYARRVEDTVAIHAATIEEAVNATLRST